MEIKKVCVIGAGTMGHGIAQVCAQCGIQVSLQDIKEDFVQAGLKKIEKFLRGSLERKRITQKEFNNILGRIKPTIDLNEAAEDADFVIEAIIENIEAKKDLFRKLDTICDQRTIFATNTSYMSITEIASVTKRPQKFVGMHWFNPPQLMRGVEVVKTEKSAKETVDTLIELCRRLGKEASVVQDSPGFIANRLLQAWRNESFKLCDEKIALPADIDNAFKTAYGFKMGPFELGDMAGLDIVLTGSETMFHETGREVFRPARCVIMKVRAGDYGRKTGQGFYEYKS